MAGRLVAVPSFTRKAVYDGFDAEITAHCSRHIRTVTRGGRFGDGLQHIYQSHGVDLNPHQFTRAAKMGRHNRDQRQLFYSFDLDVAVPRDHLVREIAAVLDLTWVYDELAPHYPSIGPPSIDPVLMIRMLIIGYVFAIRSEQALCREVQVNLPYRKKVEMLFAHLKRILRLGRLRLRGPSGSQFEFTLAAIAQNLRRLGKLIARPPPLTARCAA